MCFSTSWVVMMVGIIVALVVVPLWTERKQSRRMENLYREQRHRLGIFTEMRM